MLKKKHTQSMTDTSTSYWICLGQPMSNCEPSQKKAWKKSSKSPLIASQHLYLVQCLPEQVTTKGVIYATCTDSRTQGV